MSPMTVDEFSGRIQAEMRAAGLSDWTFSVATTPVLASCNHETRQLMFSHDVLTRSDDEIADLLKRQIERATLRGPARRTDA